jgi:hypothetical protein
MAFGFPAYQEKSERFRGVSRRALLRAAEDALVELRWRPRKDGKWTLQAAVPVGFYAIFMTWGAKVTVEVAEERLHIRSEGSFPLEWMDVGQHAENIKKFLQMVDDVLEHQD